MSLINIPTYLSFALSPNPMRNSMVEEAGDKPERSAITVPSGVSVPPLDAMNFPLLRSTDVVLGSDGKEVGGVRLEKETCWKPAPSTLTHRPKLASKRPLVASSNDISPNWIGVVMLEIVKDK